MKKMLISGSMTVFLSVAAHAESRITAYACSDNLAECELILDNETLAEPQLSFLSKNSVGKGSSDFISTAASTTGTAMSVVTSALEGIRTSVLAAGYDNFQKNLNSLADE